MVMVGEEPEVNGRKQVRVFYSDEKRAGRFKVEVRDWLE